MRISIIPVDGVVSIDGETYDHLDLSFMDKNIHAVQWYGAEGEIEWKDPHPFKLLITGNERITSMDEFQSALDLWRDAKNQRPPQEVAWLEP